MDSVVIELKDFINIAERDRKYASSTATGYRVALGLFEKELNDKERESLQTFKEHLEEIYQNVYRNNKTKFKSNTLEEYKKRVKKMIQDFENYGNDPSKMAAWTPARPNLSTNNKTKKTNNDLSISPEDDSSQIRESISLTRFELPLRANVKAIILTPSDLTSSEADKIRAYIDYLKSVSKKDE